MTPEQIREAVLSGKTFTIENVAVDSMNFPITDVEAIIRFSSQDIVNSSWIKDYPGIKLYENPEDTPVRLFKKGDKVRSKKLRGRYYSSAAQRYAGSILTVHSDEIISSRDGEVWVTFENDTDECSWNTDPVYLELVTPVEETPEYNARKYTVHEVRSGPGKIDFFAIRKGDITVAAFFCDNDKSLSEDEARVEAEYECDRLNN